MKLIKFTRTLAVLCFNLLVMLPAMSAPIDNLPAEKMQGSVTYITGGVGTAEASAMKKARALFPLSLEFVQHAKPHNVYAANVKVEIKDHHGDDVLNVTSDGPYLLSKLPAGKYTVTASFENHAQTRHVSVSEKKHAHLAFVWK